MKTTKHGIVALLVLSAVLTGCKCVYVKTEHKDKIERYRADGRLAQAGTEVGRTVSLMPTIAWALLPGANQIHIMRKIKQSPYVDKIQQDYPALTAALTAEGTAALMFSWFPYVWCYSMPIEMGSSISDVFAINNLVWMYSIDAKDGRKIVDTPESMPKSVPPKVTQDKKEEEPVAKKNSVEPEPKVATNIIADEGKNVKDGETSLESMLAEGLISQQEYNRLKRKQK